MSEHSATPPEAIERWEVAGGTWRLARLEEDRATVELLRCDGGEIVEVLTLRDPRDIRWAAIQRAAAAPATGE